jgi:hypothetical protein
MTWLLALAALLQEGRSEIVQSCEALSKVPSYHFTVKITHAGEERSLEGEVFKGEAIHLRSDRVESARSGAKRMVKPAGGDWKEPPVRRADADEPTMPHEWAAKLASLSADAKKEKSTKIGNATVDVWVHSLAREKARESLEAGGMPLWGSLTDWTKTSNGILFYVGRDRVLYRIEQRFDGKTKDGKKLENSIVLEFSDLGKAACRLPAEIREKIGIDASK